MSRFRPWVFLGWHHSLFPVIASAKAWIQIGGSAPAQRRLRAQLPNDSCSASATDGCKLDCFMLQRFRLRMDFQGLVKKKIPTKSNGNGWLGRGSSSKRKKLGLLDFLHLSWGRRWMAATVCTAPMTIFFSWIIYIHDFELYSLERELSYNFT